MTMFAKSSLRIGIILATLALPLASTSPTAQATVDPDLVVHWPLDEGSGTTATDISGHGNDGILYNGATYVPGQVGTGVHLNGIDQYVQTPTPIDTTGVADEPYALSAWVKLDTGVTSGNIVHISSQASGGGWCIPFLSLAGGTFRAVSWTSGGENDAIGTTPVVANQWYQVMTTWDATNGLRLFVNGTLEASTPQTEFNGYGAPVYVSFGLSSGCSGNQGFLKGTVDDLRIYARPLTDTDVTDLSTPDDNDGVSGAVEAAAPNSGDANGDGTPDDTQANVTSLVDPVTSHYVSLELPSSCSNSAVTATAESANTNTDIGFDYPAGFLNFTGSCGSPGNTINVKQYYYGLAATNLIVRKYDPTTHGYSTVPGATVTRITIGGQSVAVATYQITDGGPLDADHAANGAIVDPVGLGEATLTVPNTGLGGLSHLVTLR